MGGTPKRMENFAHYIMGEIGYKLPAGTQLQDISAFSYRYSMYKVTCDIFFINPYKTELIHFSFHSVQRRQ